MSELNSGKIKITNDGNIIMQFSNYHHVIDSDTELYYKHQADKVIAELEQENEALLQQNRELCRSLQVMYSKDAYDKQKYKRCLNNAWWCRKSSNAYAWNASNHRGWKIAEYYDKKAELYRKWYKRWLEIAEKFKEAKVCANFANRNH